MPPLPRTPSESGTRGPREALACVLIDPAYDGGAFRVRLADAPAGRRRAVLGYYEIPLPPEGTRAGVKLVDVLGNETVVLLSG